jgi:putative aldouronate transport system substrate-binding protein
VTSACKDVEAALRFGDLFMADWYDWKGPEFEQVMNLQFGPNGWRKAKQGEVGLSGEPAQWDWLFSWGSPTNLNYPNVMPQYASLDTKATKNSAQGIFDQEKVLWDAADIYKPFGLDNVIPPIILSSDKASQAAELRQLLQDSIVQNTARFVMGTQSIDSGWDKYVGDLKRLGLDTYMKIMQEAYDRRYK